MLDIFEEAIVETDEDAAVGFCCRGDETLVSALVRPSGFSTRTLGARRKNSWEEFNGSVVG